MTFSKARWTADEKTVHIGVEFCKVNKAKRLVSGWATLDNVDTENDVVTAEASKDAFARARGNLREMHKKDSAVGRIVSFKEDTFRAPDGKKYRGIFVTARVSEGAQDTWLKVLDGTLSGFSIGGNIVEAEEVLQKDTGETIRKVTKYDLNELSLVDNPGNQFADVTNIFKIRKSADGSVTALSGMIEEHKVLNVFYCDEHKISQEKPDDSYDCPVCQEKMEVIGFIEDGGDRDEKVNAVVTKYLSQGGETMAKANTNEDIESEDESVETGHEAGDPQEVPLQEGPTDEDEVDEVKDDEDSAEDVEEVQDDGEEIAKQIDGLKKSITDILENNKTETAQKIEALEKAIGETRDFLDTKISELGTKVSEVEQNLEVTKSKQSELETKLDKVNSSTAFKKSVDSDESSEPVQKSSSTWNGAFSVDNLLR